MTVAEQHEFEALPTPSARATWLLSKGVTASLDIDGNTLSPVWRACACGVMLPERYTGTEKEAILAGIAWLESKASPPIQVIFEPGCCPRDGDPCEHAGAGTRCCDRPT